MQGPQKERIFALDKYNRYVGKAHVTIYSDNGLAIIDRSIDIAGVGEEEFDLSGFDPAGTYRVIIDTDVDVTYYADLNI